MSTYNVSDCVSQIIQLILIQANFNGAQQKEVIQQKAVS